MLEKLDIIIRQIFIFLSTGLSLEVKNSHNWKSHLIKRFQPTSNLSNNNNNNLS